MTPPTPRDPTGPFVLSFYHNVRDYLGEILFMTDAELAEALPGKLEAIRAECVLLEDRVRARDSGGGCAMSETSKPTVGRIVHYVAYGTPGGEFPVGVCRAATVTEIDTDGAEGDVGVCVLNPTGLFFNRWLRHDEGKAPGTWHWPERV